MDASKNRKDINEPDIIRSISLTVQRIAWRAVQPYISEDGAGMPFAKQGQYYHLSADAPEEAVHAATFLSNLELIELLVKKNDVVEALVKAFTAGYFACLVHLSAYGQRPAYDAIQAYARLVAGAKKGAATTNQDHAELHGKYQQEVESAMAEQKISYSAATLAVAQTLGVSDRTVRKHSKNPNRRTRAAK